MNNKAFIHTFLKLEKCPSDMKNLCIFLLTKEGFFYIIPSLTVERIKNRCKPLYLLGCSDFCRCCEL